MCVFCALHQLLQNPQHPWKYVTNGTKHWNGMKSKRIESTIRTVKQERTKTYEKIGFLARNEQVTCSNQVSSSKVKPPKVGL